MGETEASAGVALAGAASGAAPSSSAATSRAVEGDITVDALLRGRVLLVQPRRGFRSSLDPVLLAGFVGPPYGRFLDIGAGTGAVSFLLLAKDAASTGTGVELQPRLAECAREGARLNAWGARFLLREGDVRGWAAEEPSATFDLVVTNPPFRCGSPRSPDPERAHAHHEVSLSLVEWVAVAARLVKPNGRVAAIFEAPRTHELAAALTGRGLTLTRRRFVLPHQGSPARRVLVEASPTPTPLREEPPLIVHGAENGFSREVALWLSGELGQAETST